METDFDRPSGSVESYLAAFPGVRFATPASKGRSLGPRYASRGLFVDGSLREQENLSGRMRRRYGRGPHYGNII